MNSSLAGEHRPYTDGFIKYSSCLLFEEYLRPYTCQKRFSWMLILRTKVPLNYKACATSALAYRISRRGRIDWQLVQGGVATTFTVDSKNSRNFRTKRLNG